VLCVNDADRTGAKSALPRSDDRAVFRNAAREDERVDFELLELFGRIGVVVVVVCFRADCAA
jgi:hypothetical protein